jgi:hypothetical protein
MFGVNDLEITLYFVGQDKDDAQQNIPFDSFESACDYGCSEYGVDDAYPKFKVFSARGMIDFTTMEEAK